MKADLGLLTNNFSKIFPTYESISIGQQEILVEKALGIHEVTSVNLAKNIKSRQHLRGQALSLIDKLDKFLKFLENSNKFYCYYYYTTKCYLLPPKSKYANFA